MGALFAPRLGSGHFLHTMASLLDLHALEALPHAARIKNVIEMGKQALAGDGTAQAAVQYLAAQPGFFPQTLALYALGYGSRDCSALRRVLAQASSRTVRQLARTILIDISQDAEVPEVSGGSVKALLRHAQLQHGGHRTQLYETSKRLCQQPMTDSMEVRVCGWAADARVERNLLICYCSLVICYCCSTHVGHFWSLNISTVLRNPLRHCNPH